VLDDEEAFVLGPDAAHQRLEADSLGGGVLGTYAYHPGSPSLFTSQ
jgi:hypothetical protein